MPLFVGPKLKIKRANQHIADLNATFEAFVKTDFCSLYVEKRPDTCQNIVKFHMTKSIPEEVPLVIGDAVHNLRAALDLMACDLVSMHGGTVSKWTNFPFRDTRKEVEDTINSGEIKIAGKDIIDLILDVIKPYKGGDDALCALHSLDIADKHRLLIPTVTVAGLRNVNAKVGNVTLKNCRFAVDEGGVLQIATMAGDVEIHGDCDPAFAVLFDKGQTFQGQPVIPTLHQLSQLVSGIVETVEKAYLARTK